MNELTQALENLETETQEEMVRFEKTTEKLETKRKQLQSKINNTRKTVNITDEQFFFTTARTNRKDTLISRVRKHITGTNWCTVNDVVLKLSQQDDWNKVKNHYKTASKLKSTLSATLDTLYSRRNDIEKDFDSRPRAYRCTKSRVKDNKHYPK